MTRRKRKNNGRRRCDRCKAQMHWKTTAVQVESGKQVTTLIGYWYCPECGWTTPE